MRTDVVFEPFGADAAELIRAAQVVDGPDSGIDGVWTYDHFTAMSMQPREQGVSWSRDPFALLGAYAATTQRVQLGVLVANIYNRHTVQLASAINTIQSIAGPRVTCGVGSGARPGTRFAAEQDAIGTQLESAADARRRLASTIADLRTIWSTGQLGDANQIVDSMPSPRIIVGASGEETVKLAARIADGVNIRVGPNLGHLVDVARRESRPGFEVSAFAVFDPDHPLGGDPEPLARLGVERRMLAVRSPIPFVALANVAAALASTV